MPDTESLAQTDAPPLSNGADHPAVPEPGEAGGILTVDLGAIVDNWRALARRATPAECAAVVKGDGYGCGLEPVAKALARAGCKTFFVADLGEARRLRNVVPNHAIYVLNGLLPNSAPGFAETKARPVIGSLLELAEWDGFCAAQNWRGGAALQVDTGMNRLGVTPVEAQALAPRIRAENHGITLLLSHFACSQTPAHPLNAKQIALFRDVRMLFRGIPASLANSAGIFLGSGAHCDVVRPGAALYGINPTPGERNPMRPAVTLEVQILQVRDVVRGETVGYDAQWTAGKGARIAIVGAGYGDGLPRALGSTDARPGLDVIVAGTRCPLAGRVSMDLMTVDISGLPPGAAKRGDWVTVIGKEIGVDAVADVAGTIGYEILTSLGRRYHRVYRNA